MCPVSNQNVVNLRHAHVLILTQFCAELTKLFCCLNVPKLTPEHLSLVRCNDCPVEKSDTGYFGSHWETYLFGNSGLTRCSSNI